MQTIRAIRADDAAAYLELCRRLDRETSFMLYEPDERTITVDEQRRQIESVIQSDNQTILIAENETGPIGHLQAFGGRLRRNRDTLHLVVGVLQSHARQGAGTALFRALEEWAAGIGAHRLELTVMTHNTAAIALYRKMGFEIEGTARERLLVEGRYVDEHLMAKRIQAVPGLHNGRQNGRP